MYEYYEYEEEWWKYDDDLYLYMEAHGLEGYDTWTNIENNMTVGSYIGGGTITDISINEWSFIYTVSLTAYLCDGYSYGCKFYLRNWNTEQWDLIHNTGARWIIQSSYSSTPDIDITSADYLKVYNNSFVWRYKIDNRFDSESEDDDLVRNHLTQRQSDINLKITGYGFPERDYPTISNIGTAPSSEFPDTPLRNFFTNFTLSADASANYKEGFIPTADEDAVQYFIKGTS